MWTGKQLISSTAVPRVSSAAAAAAGTSIAAMAVSSPLFLTTAHPQQQTVRGLASGGKASALSTPVAPPNAATSGTPGWERDREEMRRMNRTGEESIVRIF
jgi:hypothetical protein